MSKDAFFQILNVAEEFASHVRDAFGPMGKHVIIVDDVAKVSVTRNGLHILKSLHCADPFAQMMIRAAETHVNLVRLPYRYTVMKLGYQEFLISTVRLLLLILLRRLKDSWVFSIQIGSSKV